MTDLYPCISQIFFQKFNYNLLVDYNRLSVTEDSVYCKIIVIPDNYIILAVYLYNNKLFIEDSQTYVIFKATKADTMIHLVQKHLYIYSELSVSHSLYIGCELVKAEIALIMRQDYIQN
uniref:DUF4346 domain-containing protein n=1 Tax=Hommersandiophycus borowitzkae TaxID=268573 RepID=A0A1G4NTW1_9FLOR|nr:Hypothetical protein ORF_1 [Hommersandiophycus borowitzkae]SCW22131.1 Hypothetical protein ORF_1 [Hommersandiophycus borowitzkae]